MAVPPGLRMMFAVNGDLAKRPGEARNLGSIVAEIAMVATGGFQYAVFGGPKLWDVAAGAVIVREAGGAALTWEGGRWRPIERFRVPKPDPAEEAEARREARPDPRSRRPSATGRSRSWWPGPGRPATSGADWRRVGRRRRPCSGR